MSTNSFNKAIPGGEAPPPGHPDFFWSLKKV